MINKLPDQSLLDVCVQYTGTIESLFDVMALNNMNELIEPIAELTPMSMPPVVKKPIVDYITANNIQIATELIEITE